MLFLTERKYTDRKNKIDKMYKHFLVLALFMSAFSLPLGFRPFLNFWPLAVNIIYTLFLAAMLMHLTRRKGTVSAETRLLFLVVSLICVLIFSMLVAKGARVHFYILPIVVGGIFLLSDIYALGFSLASVSIIAFLLVEYLMPGGFAVLKPPPEAEIKAAAALNLFGASMMLIFGFRSILREFSTAEITLEAENRKTNELLVEIRTDLNAARRIQHTVMPDSIIQLPTGCARIWMQPLQEIGGDFYQWRMLRNGRLRFFLGDAMGHGVQAALMTMAIRTEFDALPHDQLDPKGALRYLNAEFYRKYSELNLYATGVVIDLDHIKQQLCFASAAHPPQFLINEKKITELFTDGPAIGLIEDAAFNQQTLNFQPESDGLILYTDGLIEACNTQGEMFGKEYLQGLIAQDLGVDVMSNAEKIFGHWSRFVAGKSLLDDVTLIAYGKMTLHSVLSEKNEKKSSVCNPLLESSNLRD